MKAAIKVEVDERAAPDLVSRVQNLGEDVYRALGRLGRLDLHAVDNAVDSFVVSEIRRRDIGTVTRLLERLARQHGFEASVRLVRLDLQAPDAT